MKIIASVLTLLVSTQSLAAATLYCNAEDGTTITATEGADSGSLYNFRMRVREGAMKDYPQAYAAQKEEQGGRISFLVVTDPKEGILAVVKGNTLVDRSGSYEVMTCEISM